MAATDTKLIEKTGTMITVTMNNDLKFKIDTSNHPTSHAYLNLSDEPTTLTTHQLETAEAICATMCQIKF